MDLTANEWGAVQKIFDSAFKSSFHFSIASLNQDGSPHVTPIGSLILRDDLSGFYFEEYAGALPRNLRHDKRVCVMAVNSGKWLLLKSFVLGKFIAPPGVRLRGTAGERREATPEEQSLFRSRVRHYRFFRGYDLLWSGLRHVRDIRFDSYEPIRVGTLTRGTLTGA